MTKATESQLSTLHNAIATHLTERIEGGEASAAEISAAISFLKNNNITCAPSDDNALGELEKIMEARRAKRNPPVLPDFHEALPEGMH